MVVAGLLLGVLAVGGLYAAEASAHARVAGRVAGPVSPPSPVAIEAGSGDAMAGRVPYDRMCASCHGTGGNGAVPLRGPLLNSYYRDDRILAGLVRNGVGSMPGTSAEQLSDQQLADVIAFMRALP